MDRSLPFSRRRLLMAAAGAPLAALGLTLASAEAAAAVPRTVPAAAPIATRGAIGISVNSSLLWESAAARQQSFAFLSAIGVTSIRLDIPWRWIEPTRGAANWGVVDPVIDTAVRSGMSVLGVLTTTPQWAALGGSDNQQTRPASLVDWRGFVDRVARRYAGRVFAYEVWNEPNARYYFAPDPDPVAYAALVREATGAIRAADPSALVIAGALGPASPGDGLMAAPEFFEAMLDAGVAGVDAYSFHPYEEEQTLAQAAFWDGTVARQVVRMHELLRSRGEGDKKIWASEFGVSSLRDADRQSETLTAEIIQWPENALAGPMYIHHHRDDSAQDGYGLATASLSPKAVAYNVQWMNAYGVPVRDEATVFAQNADASLGRAVGPVFSVADGYARDYESGVRFATPTGWYSSPAAVGDVFRRANRLPAGAFSGGMQAAAIPGGGRVFTSAAGTFLVVGAILSAWKTSLGFPTSAEYVENGTVVVQDFANGKIRWNSVNGVTSTVG